MQNSITGEAPRHRKSVVHRNPTAWHCVCHQQRGQAVGYFDVNTVLLCCTSTALHGLTIIIGIAQTSFPLEEPFSHTDPLLEAATQAILSRRWLRFEYS